MTKDTTLILNEAIALILQVREENIFPNKTLQKSIDSTFSKEQS